MRSFLLEGPFSLNMPMVTRLLKLLDLMIATLILVLDLLNTKLKD